MGADLRTLRAVHLGHATHIPFENLDIQMGLPIRLDLESLQSKLVARRRGGYCFEQNTLLLEALRTLGFGAVACEARVRQGSTEVRPRTHMVLLASVEGRPWLCDVGFGGDGPLEPVALEGGKQRLAGGSYRVVEEGDLRVLQAARSEGWEDLYAFVPEARYPIDFEVANWFTSTHPRSSFVKTLTAQLASPEARRVLRDLSYTVTREPLHEERKIERSELVPLLRETFGLEVPAGARFRALDGPRSPRARRFSRR